ncbi:Cytochrome c biogenesis protein CcsA [uncultured archaeon]|nr:Cytochrome c biogenesis protein CcsA [uncultured archaeon]
MAQIDWVLYLTSTTFYAISSIIYIYCLVFKKEEKLKFALGSAIIGLLFHSASIAMRWIATEHGPYITMYEVLSKYAWFSVVIFLLAQYKYEKIKVAGFLVMPAVLLIMGAGSTYSRDIQLIPASLRSYWLIAHVTFANLAFGSLLVATGIAALYILKERNSMKKEPESPFYKKLPELKVMDELMYQFVAAGILFLSIMIGAGAIWANQTWGRYWGWDPTETWSLIVWSMYGICLHLRMNVGWSGKRIAWYIILSLFILVFALFGVGYVYSGLHTNYLTS